MTENVPSDPQAGQKKTLTPEEKRRRVQQQRAASQRRSGASQGQQRPRPQNAQKAQGSNGGQQPEPLPNVGGVENILMRNEYYKDGYRSLLKIAIFEGVAIVSLIFVLGFFFMTTKPENIYFATTSDGRLVRMVALSQPNLSNAALLSWVAKAATETMTFGFHDYKVRLQEASRFFTRRGWESFTKALQDSSVIDAIENRKQVLSAVPGSAPVVVQEGVVNGQYRWVVEMPMIVTYKSGSSSRPDSMMVRLTVVRVPTLDNPNGVGIEQWTTGARR